MNGMIKIEVPVKELQEVRFILATLQRKIEAEEKIYGLSNEAKHTRFYFDSFVSRLSKALLTQNIEESDLIANTTKLLY